MIRVVYSLRHRLHHPRRELEASNFQTPYEHPGRAETIRAVLAADQRFAFDAPDDWGLAPIEAVHDPGLIRFLEEAWPQYQLEHGPTHDVFPDVFALAALRRGMSAGREPTPVGARLGWWCYETTTPLTHGTYDAARSSVDVALSAWSIVEAGAPMAYGLCRPPGHHAGRAFYGGYCFFNNAAIVAEHIAASTASRVAILDVDYHHGNGTQQIFYDRGDVLFVSLHADPSRAYPFHTGFADETGSGDGLGANRNFPVRARTDDDGYCEVLSAALEVVDRFDPSVVVVSLGVDTFEGDPICDLALSAEGFGRCGALVAEMGRPLVVVQEGGYADDALGENVRRWLLGADSAIHAASDIVAPAH